MPTPKNKHLLVSPIPHEDFVEGNLKLEPMGTVLAVSEGEIEFKIGDVVYFEEYLAKKFPGDKPDTAVWFIKSEDCCGIK